MIQCKKRWILIATSLIGLIGITEAHSQITLQVPTISVFELQTVVRVPDGGTMHLGGVQRSSYGRTSRSGGLLGGVPLIGRGFRNSAVGKSNSAENASIRVQIIDLKEMEREVLRQAERRAAIQRQTDPNGTVKTQQQADFITRNIGKNRSKRQP